MKYIKSLLLALTFLFMAVSSANDTGSGVTAIDPYIRAIPPGLTTSAMFLGLENGTDQNRSLVKVHSDIAKNIELHEHVHEEGMMKMRQVQKIEVSAKGKTTLKPGGYHVMLINLNKPIAPKDKINLTLVFDDGSKQDIVAEVRMLNMGMGGMKNIKHHKGMHSMKNGKMMGGMGNNKEAKHAMKHANPAPNLMQAIITMGDQLGLDDKQQATLKKWRGKRGPIMKELALNIMKMEKAIYNATLAGEPEEIIKAITLKLMKARTDMIEGKIKCRDNMRKVLSEEQFKKLVTLYKEMHG